MFNVYAFITVFSITVTLILSLFIFLRNPKAKLNRLFFLSSILIAGWLATNYLGSTLSVSYDIAIVANKLTFFLGAAGSLAIFYFSANLAHRKSNFISKALTIFNAYALLFSLTPVVVSYITPSQNTWTIGFGSLANFYFFVLFANVVMTLFTLLSAHRKLTGFARSQINSVLIGLAGFLLGVIITNAVLPIALNYYGLTNAGALFSLLLTGGMAYAITKHKLFDIRLIIARSLAYATALITIALLYGLVIFAASKYIFNLEIPISAQIFLALATAIAALSFTRIQTLFDRLTNKIFYRDAYNSSLFLDQLNKVLVSNIEIEPLLSLSAGVISSNLKSEYCAYYIEESSNQKKYKIVGNSGFDNTSGILSLINQLEEYKDRIVVLDEIESGKVNLRNEMSKNNASVSVRLDINESGKTDKIGYLILGSRKSGNAYVNQDIIILDIIAKELVIAVQNALRFEEIEQFNITLQEKIDVATSQLTKANKRLKALDETKDDFISMASHQLRTPLSVIKGYVNMVSMGDAGKVNKQQKEFLDQALDGSESMVRLVSELLNVSRITSGKFSIEASPVNLADLVDAQVKQLTNMAASKEITLNYQKPENFPSIMLDEDKTKQVIINFIDNAIHYSKPKGAKIDIQLTASDEIIFKVVDNGIGVPNSEKDHLFTKFYRAKNAKLVRPDGTGVGIYLAKVVINEQGGDLIFESKEGEGSTFGFKFKQEKITKEKA